MEKIDYVGGFEYSTVKDRIEELKKILEDANELEKKSSIDFSRAKILKAEIEVLKAQKELAELEQRGQEELDKIQENIDNKAKQMNRLKENAEKMRNQVLTAQDNLETIQRSVDMRINELRDRDPDISGFIQNTLKDRYMQEMENVNKQEEKYNREVKKVSDAKDLISNSEVQVFLSKIIKDEKELKEIKEKISNTKDTKEIEALNTRKSRLLGYIRSNKDKLKGIIGPDKSINVDELIKMTSESAEYKDETITQKIKKGKDKGKEIKKKIKVIDFEKTLNNIQEPAEKDFASEKAVYEKLIKEIEQEQEKDAARKERSKKKEKKKEKEQDAGNGKKRGFFSRIVNFFNRYKLPEGRGEQANNNQQSEQENNSEARKNPLEEKRKEYAKSVLVKDYIRTEAERREKRAREKVKNETSRNQSRSEGR